MRGQRPGRRRSILKIASGGQGLGPLHPFKEIKKVGREFPLHLFAPVEARRAHDKALDQNV